MVTAPDGVANGGDMKHVHQVLIVLTVALTAACVPYQAKLENTESVPASKPAPAKAPPAKAAPAKESGKKEEAAEVAVVAKPAPAGKFAKLKIGMTLNQVERLMGRPAKQWQHPTEKAKIPFYFGPDRWVIQYSYKGEGVLTFNSGGEQLLTLIEINKAE